MPPVPDDPQYNVVIKILKGLPKVNASPSFEMDLRRRLNAEANTVKESWYKRLLTPSRLIPSTVLAAAAVILFIFINVRSPQADDPLAVQPRLRDDISAVKPDAGNANLPQAPAEKRTDQLITSREQLGYSSSISTVAKSGLNFRQVNLSEAEKEKIRHLKEKLRNWLK